MMTAMLELPGLKKTDLRFTLSVCPYSRVKQLSISGVSRPVLPEVGHTIHERNFGEFTRTLVVPPETQVGFSPFLLIDLGYPISPFSDMNHTVSRYQRKTGRRNPHLENTWRNSGRTSICTGYTNSLSLFVPSSRFLDTQNFTRRPCSIAFTIAFAMFSRYSRIYSILSVFIPAHLLYILLTIPSHLQYLAFSHIIQYFLSQ